jgi:hypothetical protein
MDEKNIKELEYILTAYEDGVITKQQVIDQIKVIVEDERADAKDPGW